MPVSYLKLRNVCSLLVQILCRLVIGVPLRFEQVYHMLSMHCTTIGEPQFFSLSMATYNEPSAFSIQPLTIPGLDTGSCCG